MASVHLRPTPSTPLHPPDQHLHDPPVQLRQRPAWPVHLRVPGEVRPVLDQPQAADPAPHPAGREVLPDLPPGTGSSVAGQDRVHAPPGLRQTGRRGLYSIRLEYGYVCISCMYLLTK